MTRDDIIVQYRATQSEVDMLDNLHDISSISPVQVIMYLSEIKLLSKQLKLMNFEANIRGIQNCLNTTAVEGIVSKAIQELT